MVITNTHNSSGKITVSLLLSLTVHALFFVLLVFTISDHKPTPPIMVNLQKNAKPEQNVIKAGLVNKKSIDLAVQRHADAEKAKQQRIIEQQQKVEQLKQEQIKQTQEQAQAKIALELAAAQKAKLEVEAKKVAQQKLVQEKAEKFKALKDKADQQKLAQAKAIQEKATQEKLSQAKAADQSKQLLAQKQKEAAALKAQNDRFQAEHNALFETEVDQYTAEIRAAIEDNRIVSNVFAKNAHCAIRIRLLPDGSILSVNVTEPSGNPAYDAQQIAAVYKAQPFSMPQDHEVYERLRDIVLSFRNGEQSGDA